MDKAKQKVFLGITGASGTTYGIRTANVLHSLGFEVHASITKSGLINAERECNQKFLNYKDFFKKTCPSNIFTYDENDIAAGPASGSFRIDHYIFAPASMGFTGRVASGISSNLLERAADVAMKEHRPFALLFREAPLSIIHLQNLLRLAQTGVFIIPASPAFYNKPSSVEDMADFVVGKTLDILKIDNKLFNRWQ